MKNTQGRKHTRLYMAWINMRRCCGHGTSATARQRLIYRGISVCREWQDCFPQFESWCLDHGWKDGMCVVRIDKTKDFSPENCTVSSRQVANVLRRFVRNVSFESLDEIGTMDDGGKIIEVKRNGQGQ